MHINIRWLVVLEEHLGILIVNTLYMK